MTWPPTVLVVGADGRQGLTIVRSLGRQGIRVVAGHTGRDVGVASRYARLSARFPTGAHQRDDFANALRIAVRDHGVTTVFPGPEAAVIALDAVRDHFPELTLLLPDRSALHTALDKSQTRALFASLALPVPTTDVVNSVTEARQFAATAGYPLVLKPVARPSFKGSGSIYKVAYAGDGESLERLVRYALDHGNTLIVQSYAPGIKLQHGLLASDGNILACYEYLGIRELPITGGVTSLHQSQPITPEIFRVTERVMRALRWTGLAGVEYRYAPSGEFTILEINGRAWGSIAGAEDAGIDFPWLALRHAHGQPLPVIAPYRTVRTQDIIGDVQCWLRRRHAPTAFPEPLPTSAQLFRAVVRDLVVAKSEYWAWDDPGPGVLAGWRAGTSILRTCGGRFRHRLRAGSGVGSTR
jgi:biotin carboxylase